MASADSSFPEPLADVRRPGEVRFTVWNWYGQHCSCIASTTSARTRARASDTVSTVPVLVPMLLRGLGLALVLGQEPRLDLVLFQVLGMVFALVLSSTNSAGSTSSTSSTSARSIGSTSSTSSTRSSSTSRSSTARAAPTITTRTTCYL